MENATHTSDLEHSDSYGDGLQGSLWQGQDGSYFLKQCGDTLVAGTDPAYGILKTYYDQEFAEKYINTFLFDFARI